MIPGYLMHYPWIPAVAWLVIYTSDYYLTLWGAKLSRAQNIIAMEGSYELTPEYVRDVDELRKLSPTFLVWLMVGAAVLLIAAQFAHELPECYGVVVGYLVIMELAIHMRHFANICFYRWLADSDNAGIEGRIYYPRAVTYRLSAIELFALAVFLFIAFGMTNGCILLGGGIGVMCLAYSHWKLAAKCAKAPKAEKEPESAPHGNAS
jgi:hypothetical protein